MISKQIGEVKFCEFENLSKFPQIKHFVSTRKGGVSKPPYDTLNLSYASGQSADDPEDVLENRNILAGAVNIPLENFVFQNQVHSANVIVVTEQQRGHGVFNRETSVQNCDSLVTNESNLCLTVFAADCVPILLFDPVKKAIGAVHSGWKGTIAQIAQHAVFEMISEFGTDPKDLVVGIGPSIGPESYEIDTPVIEVFNKEGWGEFITKTDETHGLLNLWEVNKRILLNGGVQEQNIEVSRIDTFTNNDLFYSDRKQRPSGRFVAGIVLN